MLVSASEPQLDKLKVLYEIANKDTNTPNLAACILPSKTAAVILINRPPCTGQLNLPYSATLYIFYPCSNFR